MTCSDGEEETAAKTACISYTPRPGLTASLHDLEYKNLSTTSRQETRMGITLYHFDEESYHAEERPCRPPPMAYRVTVKARALLPSENTHAIQPIRARFCGTVASSLCGRGGNGFLSCVLSMGKKKEKKNGEKKVHSTPTYSRP